jgi:hypothetical protein
MDLDRWRHAAPVGSRPRIPVHIKIKISHSASLPFMEYRMLHCAAVAARVRASRMISAALPFTLTFPNPAERWAQSGLGALFFRRLDSISAWCSLAHAMRARIGSRSVSPKGVWAYSTGGATSPYEVRETRPSVVVLSLKVTGQGQARLS